MTRDEELWGAAIAIQKLHGERAHLYLAERIGAAATSGDEAGVEMLKDLAKRLDELTCRTNL